MSFTKSNVELERLKNLVKDPDKITQEINSLLDKSVSLVAEIKILETKKITLNSYIESRSSEIDSYVSDKKADIERRNEILAHNESLLIAATVDISEKQKSLSLRETELDKVVQLNSETRDSLFSFRAELDGRERTIELALNDLARKSSEFESQLKMLDEKQGVISVKIATNEALIQEIDRKSTDLEIKKSEIALEKKHNEELLEEVRERVQSSQKKEKTIDEKSQELAQIRLSLEDKDKNIQAKENELVAKQLVIDGLNKDMNIQKRELSALQSRVQRLITLNNIEKEVSGT
jgi:chromosome segregation ATPase